jgi:ubiquinone/menaquinone biosynthesis C-methylase UbiE
MPIPENKVQRIFPVRIALFVGCMVLTILVLNTIVQGVQTLSRLEVIERERDYWQRPSAILETLNITAGNVVVDLGSGSGYFSLKLSSIVGRRGQVLAVDIRRMPLFFLWVRALMHGMYNIKVIPGDVDHPHLPAGAADAVLVANTYHEFTNPKSILEDLFRSLRSGGRLVILDRGPHSANGQSGDLELQHHEIPAAVVENEIRRTGFEVISRQDRFIDRAGDQPWWLLVARKP